MNDAENLRESVEFPFMFLETGEHYSVILIIIGFI